MPHLINSMKIPFRLDNALHCNEVYTRNLVNCQNEWHNKMSGISNLYNFFPSPFFPFIFNFGCCECCSVHISCVFEYARVTFYRWLLWKITFSFYLCGVNKKFMDYDCCCYSCSLLNQKEGTTLKLNKLKNGRNLGKKVNRSTTSPRTYTQHIKHLYENSFYM